MVLKRFLLLFANLCVITALPDEGKWDFNLSSSIEHSSHTEYKSLYKGAQIFININCEASTDTNVSISYSIIRLKCWGISNENLQPSNNGTVISSTASHRCNDHIQLEKEILKEKSLGKYQPVYTTLTDGLYMVTIQYKPYETQSDTILYIHLEMKSDYGYLSASDWPLLPFYAFMCFFYIILGLAWLVMSFLQWRDLLRVQFWIGGVILLGMLEKATFYAEFQSINSTGVRIQEAMLFAEWVSCAKRTLARMLVVIVSLGFGIVKPRLGAALHRVVGVGFLYFFLAVCEAYLRVTHSNNERSKDLIVASVPLAVLDSAICWWIFSALVNTTRTLRLRRNEVKLQLYRHFTNTLIFSVFASVIFMLYAIFTHQLVSCLPNWKDLWLDDAYWHILFSALLLVIMILWRPTNNNQRYAFVPLLETADDEEEEQLVNDAYGVKVRLHNNRSSSPKASTLEEDMKWLEDNVTIDPPLPVLDSDEELVNTRFEVSKMQ